jgi:3-phenylpropionate/trans-cinnamate dioxygenase ferredoxin subunit
VPRIRVGIVSDFPAGEVRVIETKALRLAVANASGNLYAFDDLCTHDGGPLGEGELDGSAVVCPRHGAKFDVRTGRALTLPAVKPVRTYPVIVEGDEVFIEVGE